MLPGAARADVTISGGGSSGIVSCSPCTSSDYKLVQWISNSLGGNATYGTSVAYFNPSHTSGAEIVNGHTFTATQSTDGTTVTITVDGQTSVVGLHASHTDYLTEGGVGILVAALAPAVSTSAASSTPNGITFKMLANYTGSDPTMVALSNAVNNLTSSADIKKAGAQLRPETTHASDQVATSVVGQALGTVQTRVDGVRTAAAEQSGVASGELPRGLGTWAQVFGDYADQGAKDGVDGYTAGTWGLAAGADAGVLDDLRVGLSFAYARTDVNDSGSRSGSGETVNSYIATLYGSYVAPKWYVDGTLSYGWHDFDGTRLVNFTGAPPEIAKGSFSGQQYGAKAEFGYPLQIRAVTATPLASLQYSHFHQDGYTETGAGSGDLAVGSSDSDSIRSGLGGKVAAKVGEYSGWEFRPNARFVWLHEFNGSAPQQTSSFTGGGTAFTVPGLKVEREHFGLGTGLDVASARGVTVSVKYDADLAAHYVDHSGQLQARVDF
jgi:outer membrane autotransporter protein